MNRRTFCKSLFSAAAALALPRSLHSAAAEELLPHRPNIILILADDLGLGNLSCFGGPFKTPNLDALARSGTRFDHCFSTPLCGPSRAQLLTGRYPFRTGMTSNQTGPSLKPANETLIPRVLEPAGYATAQVGKWAQLPLNPGDWGFDEYLCFPRSGRYWREQTPSYTQNGEKKNLPAGVYLPDLMHTFAVDFITRHKDQPFFLYYSMSHIHGPIVKTPDTKPGHDLYADNITYMDKLVGKLMDHLNHLHLRQKTLVLFVGDNGTAQPQANRATVNGRPLSGRKGTMLEGGSRVPLIASWPGTTPAEHTSHDLIDFSDFLPTFAQLAGAKLPPKRTIDGRTFAPQLKAKPGNPRGWVYVELAGKHYVRTNRWKLTNTGQFFDMKEAPFAEIPVPPESPDLTASAARKELQHILTTLTGDTPPTPKSEPNRPRKNQPRRPRNIPNRPKKANPKKAKKSQPQTQP